MSASEELILSAKIPPIPKTLEEILRLADQPTTSGIALEELVSQEPALVSQLLKWINSAAYALPRKVSSIRHAMLLLGFSAVKSVATGMMMIQSLEGLGGLPKEYVEKIWNHTLGCANLMRTLAKREPRVVQEDLYLAAILHDVGHLILCQVLAEPYQKLTATHAFPNPQDEIAAVKVEHGEAGEILLENWRFPERTCQLVAFHHEPNLYPGDPKEIAYLQMADFLVECPDKTAFFAAETPPPQFADWMEKTKWSWKELKKLLT